MKLEFRNLEISDKFLFESFTKGKKLYGWEYNFAMIWCWNVFDTTKIYVDENMLIVYTVFFNKAVFFPPIAKNGYDINNAIQEIVKYCKEQGFLIEIKGIDAKYIDLLSQNIYSISSNKNDFDYIYSTNDLSNLVGKKYHSKRNYITRFESSYTFEFNDYAGADFNDLIALYDAWYVKSVHQTLDLERRAIIRALQSYKELELKIGVLRASGKVVGYSISNIFDEVAHAMFEKADVNCVGSYQEINKLTVNKYFTQVKLVNRQEDMGIEGLRKVKQSYYPMMILPKFTIEVK